VSLRLALAQVQAGPDPITNRERCEEAVIRAAEAGAGLVCFAELAHLPFFPQDPSGAVPTAWAEPVPGPTTERLRALACDHEIVIVYNLFERDGERTFDSSPVIDADGSLRGVTRMVHIAEFEGFHETRYYAPGDRGAPVYETQVGRIGVAICYDRHFPEYMRLLGLAGAELVLIPQAGVAGEWADGMFEAEVRVAAFQNGYFAGLCNRVGEDGKLSFAGESFVCDPEGEVLGRAASNRDDLLVVDLDLGKVARSTARRLFHRDRRPDQYNQLPEEINS
jgi:N-carbamoylputrescine amidase